MIELSVRNYTSSNETTWGHLLSNRKPPTTQSAVRSRFTLIMARLPGS
jgi:hypothetical protein